MKALFLLPLGVIGPWQVVIICLVILLLFGGKKIPELMKGLGQGVKSFKQGMKDVENDVNDIKAELDAPAKEPSKIEKVQEKKEN